MRGRGVAIFLVVAFGWSWAIGALSWRLHAMASPLLLQPIGFVYMWGPALGAWAAVTVCDKGRRLQALISGILLSCFQPTTCCCIST